MENQIVVFTLATEYYGLSISSVESIVKLQAITSIPHAPEFIEGITNLRGVVLPIMDLRKRFGYPTQDTNKDSRIIVINLNEVKIGLIVDEVSEVLTITDTCIEPTPSVTTSMESQFVSGIAKINHRLIILLDLSRLMEQEPQKLLGVGQIPSLENQS